MIRQYYAQRARGGDNPLRVGTVAAGSIFYLQDEGFFRDRYGGTAVCRTPWQVLGFLNGTMGAAPRNRDTGRWEDAYRSGRSDVALMRSLRDTCIVRQVAVRTLVLHDGGVSLNRRKFCRPLTFQISMVGATVRSVWKGNWAWAGCHQLSVF